MLHICIIIIILILHLSVRESGRSREGHSTRANNFSFSSLLDLNVTCSSSLTQLAMALAAAKVSCFEDRKVTYVRRPGDGK